LIAAPLLTTTTLLPGRSGLSSASRNQVNAILTSECQLTEKVSQLWCCSGRITGLAPATRMRTSGSYRSRRVHAAEGSAASATSVRMLACAAASSVSAADRDHRSAGGGERQGDAAAEASAGADDDGCAIRQVSHDVPSMVV
jgi:hypothetical protein